MCRVRLLSHSCKELSHWPGPLRAGGERDHPRQQERQWQVRQVEQSGSAAYPASTAASSTPLRASRPQPRHFEELNRIEAFTCSIRPGCRFTEVFDLTTLRMMRSSQPDPGAELQDRFPLDVLHHNFALLGVFARCRGCYRHVRTTINDHVHLRGGGLQAQPARCGDGFCM